MAVMTGSGFEATTKVHLRTALQAVPAYTPGKPAAAPPGVTAYTPTPRCPASSTR